MNLLTLSSVFVILLVSGCGESLNYDIEEVAPAEFLSDEEEPCDSETCADPSHDHEHEGLEHGEEGHEHEETSISGGESLAEEHSTDIHLHGEGVRNHGTQWFFNQPWAADFVWGKMLRDAVILIVLATMLLVLPRLLRKRR